VYIIALCSSLNRTTFFSFYVCPVPDPTENIKDARTKHTDYQNLVDSLLDMRPQLKSLRLPGDSWTLPGAMRKPLPRFDLFMELQRLVVPQAAILCITLDNMESPEVKGNFNLSPIGVLPPQL
jgi:hypothetical protein